MVWGQRSFKLALHIRVVNLLCVLEEGAVSRLWSLRRTGKDPEGRNCFKGFSEVW